MNMSFVIEVLILIIFFTGMCIYNTNHVEEHIEWAVLNYPPKVVERLIEIGRVKEEKPVPVLERLKRKLPILVLFIALLVAILYFVNGCRDFMSAFKTCFLIWFIVDWYDAFILDCGWFCHSKKVRVKGTEDMDKEYGDYWFHIKGSFNGMILGLIVSGVVGLIIQIL